MMFCCRLDLKRCESIRVFMMAMQRLFHTFQSEDNDGEYSCHEGETNGSDTARDADGSSDPKSGCCGQPFDLPFLTQLQYRARADKADAGNNALHHAR